MKAAAQTQFTTHARGGTVLWDEARGMVRAPLRAKHIYGRALLSYARARYRLVSVVTVETALGAKIGRKFNALS